MRRAIGTGVLLAGACGACWAAPLLVAALGAGGAGAIGAGWTGAIALAGAALIAPVLLRRARRRRGSCACEQAGGR